jgi:hypothetical protein
MKKKEKQEMYTGNFYFHCHGRAQIRIRIKVNCKIHIRTRIETNYADPYHHRSSYCLTIKQQVALCFYQSPLL